MKKNNILLVISLLTIPALILLSGCQEKQASSGNAKMNKLLAEENMRLETELANRDEILLDQIKMLQKCGQEKVEMQKKTEEITSFLMQQVNSELKIKAD